MQVARRFLFQQEGIKKTEIKPGNEFIAAKQWMGRKYCRPATKIMARHWLEAQAGDFSRRSRGVQSEIEKSGVGKFDDSKIQLLNSGLRLLTHVSSVHGKI
jgi:hypothetical protein